MQPTVVNRGVSLQKRTRWGAGGSSAGEPDTEPGGGLSAELPRRAPFLGAASPSPAEALSWTLTGEAAASPTREHPYQGPPLVLGTLPGAPHPLPTPRGLPHTGMSTPCPPAPSPQCSKDAGAGSPQGVPWGTWGAATCARSGVASTHGTVQLCSSASSPMGPAVLPQQRGVPGGSPAPGALPAPGPAARHRPPAAGARRAPPPRRPPAAGSGSSS